MNYHSQPLLIRKFIFASFFLSILTVFPSIAGAARSIENRAEKSISATLGAYGLSAALFATDKTLVEGSYNYRQTDDVWVNTFKSRIRTFFGNSFYGGLGCDYERLNAPPREFGGPAIEADKVILATGVLGNQWQWSAFTLGIDWVEFRVPISRIASAQFTDPIRARSSPTVLGGLEINVFGVYAGISI